MIKEDYEKEFDMPSITDKLLSLEQEYNLLEKSMYSIKYWQYIRSVVFMQIRQEIENKNINIKTGKSVSQKKPGIIRYLLRMRKIIDLLSVFFIMSPVRNLKERDLLVLTFPRRVKVDNHFDFVYTEELLASLKLSYYVFESPRAKMYNPIRTENLISTKFLTKLAIRSKIMFKYLHKYRLSPEERVEIFKLTQLLNVTFEINLRYETIINLVQELIYQWFGLKKTIGSILDNINPKLIIEVSHTLRHTMIVNSIAKAKGIPVIEIQHGIMGQEHISYNYSGIKSLQSFPDYMFIFGEYWKDTTRLPLAKERVISTGFPYFEQCKRKYEFNVKKQSDIKYILFTSQGIVSKELSNLALNLVKQIDMSKFKIIYKLHPSEYKSWEREYSSFLDSGIEIIHDNNIEIYYFLALADFHIGVSSTCLLEGLGFGLKTIIYKAFTHENMAYFYKNKYATLASSCEEVISAIKNTDVPNIRSTYLWEENALENMYKNIDIILSN